MTVTQRVLPWFKSALNAPDYAYSTCDSSVLNPSERDSPPPVEPSSGPGSGIERQEPHAPYVEAISGLTRIEALCLSAGSEADIVVTEVKALLAGIPQCRAHEFLARRPGSAEEAPLDQREVDVVGTTAKRDERLALLRDLYLEHFRPYLDNASPYVGQDTLRAMARAWTPAVVVKGITRLADARQQNYERQELNRTKVEFL